MLVLHCEQDFVLPYAEHAVEGFARLADPAWLVSMPCNEHAQPYEDDPSAFDGLVEDLTLDLWASVLGHDAGRRRPDRHRCRGRRPRHRRGAGSLSQT